MRSRRPYDRALRLGGVALALMTLAGPVSILPVFAQQAAPPASSGLFDSLFRAPALRADPPVPADWVRQSRPQIIPDASRPTSRTKPERPLMTADQIRRREAELDALRARQDRLAGRKPARGSYRSAAGDPIPAVKPPARRCVLTCPSPIGRLEKK